MNGQMNGWCYNCILFYLKTKKNVHVHSYNLVVVVVVVMNDCIWFSDFFFFRSFFYVSMKIKKKFEWIEFNPNE